MSVKIIVDSTADVCEGIRDRLTVVPLTVSFGSEQYIDGVTITHRQFYEKLVESDVLPTTSQPTPQSFADIFEKTVKNGDEAIVLTIASELSGTFQSASIAAEDFPGKVWVIDGRTVAIGTGVLAELAVQLVDQGLSAEEIVRTLTEDRENIRIVALLDTLEYLKRGGRISRTAAFAGGILSIKPVISVMNGEIVLLGKARGSKQGNNLLISEIRKAGGVDYQKPILLGYTGLSDALLTKYVEDSGDIWRPHVDHLNRAIVGSVVGTHAGPNGVAVAFYCRQK